MSMHLQHWQLVQLAVSVYFLLNVATLIILTRWELEKIDANDRFIDKVTLYLMCNLTPLAVFIRVLIFAYQVHKKEKQNDSRTI